MQDREYILNRSTPGINPVDELEKQGMVVANVVLVKTDRTRKVALFRHDDLPLKPGDSVVVETERGTAGGVVMRRPEMAVVPAKDLMNVLRLIRGQGIQDTDSALRNKEREAQARDVCAKFVATLGLDMNVVSAEYVPWENRVVLYFVAEGRIDFRDLVKEISRMLRCRIEMRQIGPRDETRMLGGVARCGREFCCSSHLKDFGSVRTKMAKEQGLVVNQEKITGHCRKLLCCLAYERDAYLALRTNLPALGSFVETPSGHGKVVELQILRQAVKVQVQSDMTYKVFALSEIKIKDKAVVTDDSDDDDEPHQESAPQERPRRDPRYQHGDRRPAPDDRNEARHRSAQQHADVRSAPGARSAPDDSDNDMDSSQPDPHSPTDVMGPDGVPHKRRRRRRRGRGHGAGAQDGSAAPGSSPDGPGAQSDGHHGPDSGPAPERSGSNQT